MLDKKRFYKRYCRNLLWTGALCVMALLSYSPVFDFQGLLGSGERTVAAVYSTPDSIELGTVAYENAYPTELRDARPDLSMHPLVLEKFIQHLDTMAAKTPIHHADGSLAFKSIFDVGGNELAQGITPNQYGDRLEMDLWKAGLTSMRRAQMINGISYNADGDLTIAQAVGIGMEDPLAWNQRYSLLQAKPDTVPWGSLGTMGTRTVDAAQAAAARAVEKARNAGTVRNSVGVSSASRVRSASYTSQGVSYSSGASRTTPRSHYRYRPADSGASASQRGRAGI